MPRRSIVMGSVIAFAAVAGAYAACDVQEPDVNRSADLTVVVHTDYEFPLRDNPSKAPTNILIVVSGMSAHHATEGWIELGTYAGINLLAPEEAVPKLLSQGQLPEGMYDQIRLEVDYATVQVDRLWYPLEIPSEDESGIKIHATFCMADGYATTVDTEWNVDEALHYSDQRGYWLTPSIEVFSPPTCVDDMRTPPLPNVPR